MPAGWDTVAKYRALREAIVEAVVEARKKKGLSQRALSKVLDEYPNYMQEVESLQHWLKAEELVMICETLEVPVGQLLSKARRSMKSGKP